MLQKLVSVIVKSVNLKYKRGCCSLMTLCVISIGGVCFSSNSFAENDYPYADKKFDDLITDGYGIGFYYRECTSFVAWRMNRDKSPTAPTFQNVMKGPNGTIGRWSNGGNWEKNAREQGYIVDSIPAVGAIAQFNASGTYPVGHVAYVEAVNPDGSVNLSEYNITPATYGERFNIKTVSNFIHINDGIAVEWLPNAQNIVNYADGNIKILGTGFGISTGRIDVYIPFLTNDPINSDRTVTLNAASVLTWINTEVVLKDVFNNINGFAGYAKSFNLPFVLSVYKSDGSLAASFNFPFFDVSSDDSLSCYVMKLWKERGIQGKGGNRFDPFGKVTRAEFLKIALNAKFGPDKYKIPPNVSIYSDVSNQWYASYVNDAKQKGFLNALFDSCYASGVFAGAGEAKCFGPDKAITRFEATSILTGVFGLSTSAAAVSRLGRQFLDAPNFYPYSTYVYPAATTKGNAGCYGDEYIVRGYGDGRFGVNDPLRRDQAAKLIALAKGQ